MAQVQTNSLNYTAIADAIRDMSYRNDTFLPSQMDDAILSIPTGIPAEVTADVHASGSNWTRPSSWPDLDTVTIPSDFNGLYLTYDLTKTPGQSFIGLYVLTSGNGSTYTVERGHLSNGTFVSDYSTVQSSAYFRASLSETNGTVQLWRVTSSSPITRFGHVASTDSTSTMFYNMLQPCVERKGRLPNVTNTSSYTSVRYNVDDVAFGTFWLEKDDIDIGASSVVTTLAAMYYRCYRLTEVNTDWDTSAWKVTACNSMFDSCSRLREIDLSSWDTSGWKVTTTGYMFSNCASVQEITGLSDLDVSGWTVATMASMFQGCVSLRDIDLSEWDVSGWAVTTTSAAFSNCRSAEKIDVSTWNTSNWAVTNLSSTFNQCLSLTSLDVSGWDTSNWKPTTIASLFYGCIRLREIDLSSWDVSGWTTLANIGGLFRDCQSLREIDLSSWNTSAWQITTFDYLCYNCFCLTEAKLPFVTTNWAVTTLASTFAYCRSLRTLDLSTWNTSNWAVTNLSNTFINDFSLTEIKGLKDFDTSNWAVTTMVSMFAACYSLKELDLSKWDTSNWEVTTVATAFSGCYALETCSISGWDTSNWKLTTMANMFSDCRGMKSIDLSGWDASGWNLTTMQTIVSTGYSLETFYFPSNLSESNCNPSSANYQMTYDTTNNGLRNTNGYPIKQNVNYSTYYCLTTDSLVAIIGKLPTLTSAKTLTLGSNLQNKLTSAQIAVATQKGWTVA